VVRVVAHTSIDASPDIVWADIERLETHVEWMADAAAIEFGDDRRRGVGTTMRVLTTVGPLRTVDIIRVVGWDPPRSIAVTHEGLVTGKGEFILEPTPTGTRFVWAEDLSMPWYFGGPVGAALARPVLAAVWRRNLQRLAARFE